MKISAILTIAISLSGLHAQAQVFISGKVEISFYSETPLENIEAVNHKSSSMLNTADKQVVFQIPVKAFEFKKDLMREHFNENYLETEKYPKASFDGKIGEDIDFSVDGSYNVTATGILAIHGVEQKRTLNGVIKVNGDELTLNGEFKVTLSDHKIRIPKVVIANIAEVVDVKVEAVYQPYVKKL